MKRNTSTVLIYSILWGLYGSFLGLCHADPQLSSWFTDYSGAYARTYTNDTAAAAQQVATTWSKGSGSQSQPTYVGIHEIQYNDDWVYVRSTGLGAHIMGPWPNNFPNFPANFAAIHQIPRFPVPAAGIEQTGGGPIGIFVDGVAMFDSRDAFSFNQANGVDATPMNGLTGDRIWNRDAYVNEGSTFDPALAHQAGARYHYHANAPGLRHLIGDHVDYDAVSNRYIEVSSNLKHSPILAWVNDGFPLYGPYGYSDATNEHSGVRRMITGYQYRDGSNGSMNLATAGRANYPAWAARVYNRRGDTNDASLLIDEQGPAVAPQYPIGHYMEDYAYKGDLGMTQGMEFDLDEHNGRWCVTPEFPAGTFAYFVSIAADGTPMHPYNIGRTFYGEPTGDDLTNIPGSNTIYFEGGPEAASQSLGIVVAGGQVTTEWFSVEGALSNMVECSTNLVNWAPVSAGLATNGHVITAMDVLGVEDTKYYRHMRADRVAPFDDMGFDHNVPIIGSEGEVQLLITLDADLANDPPRESTMGGNPITPTSVTINGQTATFIDRPSRYEMNIEFDPTGWAPGTYTIEVEWTLGSNDPFTITAITTYTVAAAPRNILLLIVDDWAIDSHNLYNTNVGVTLPPTPTINTLATSGIRFTKAYAQPTCSPTRAAMITGRYGFRTSVTTPVGGGSSLQGSEITLPEAFSTAGAPHAVASFGKWHLSSGANGPNTVGGWPHFSGTLGGGLNSYTNYAKNINGVSTQVTQYGTTDIVDDTTAWLAAQGNDPWFCWVGFNAGHTPFHNPPTNLHSYVGIPETPTGPNRRRAYEAAIEALDTELARLLQSVDMSNTTIILLGDNGTPGSVVQTPYSSRHAKGSLYDGGGHVPFIISGAGVSIPNTVNTSVVHCIDIFSTILELAEIDQAVVIPTNVPIDSISLVPSMTGGVFSNHIVMMESSTNVVKTVDRSLYDGQYRLIQPESGTNELYDVSVDISETNDLLQGILTIDQQRAHDALEAQSLLWQ